MRGITTLFISVIFLSLFFFQPILVVACTNSGLYELQYLVDEPDTIAVGKFVDLDDQNLNGTFQVDYYLRAMINPEYMLLSVNKTTDIERYLELRSTGGECPYVIHGLERDKTFMMFGQHQVDGSFEVIALIFDPPEAKTTFIYPSFKQGDTSYKTQSFSVNELENFLTAKLGLTHVPPDKTFTYPLTSPLLITTATSSNYLLPVDGTHAIKLSTEDLEMYNFPSFCNEPKCKAFSPNHLDTATLLGRNEIEPNLQMSTYNQFNANAVSFSSTNDSLAVWRDTSIEIYPLFYPRVGFNWFRNGFINSTPLELTTSSKLVYGLAAWSPDGRLLAYSDSIGLWIWDAFTVGSHPSLLIATKKSSIPYARYFSEKGRYVAVRQADQNYFFDTVSGSKLPDGLISPDERSMLVFDTSAKPEFSVKFQWLVPSNRVSDIQFTQVYQVQWMSKDNYLLAMRAHGYATENDGYIDEDYRIVNQESLSFGLFRGYLGSAFAYDNRSKTIAVVSEDKKIRINTIQYDLSSQLDAPITAIKWLPSLYYYNSSP